jgi:hypothetical protein
MKPTGDFVANGAPGRATLRFSNRTFSRQSPLALEWHDLFDALPARNAAQSAITLRRRSSMVVRTGETALRGPSYLALH